jgi:hypothetical protein
VFPYVGISIFAKAFVVESISITRGIKKYKEWSEIGNNRLIWRDLEATM